MTRLGLHVALSQAGCDLALVGTRHAARLRGAISGKNKSDVIDADVLAMAGDVFTLSPLRPPAPSQLALRRAVVRRGKLVVDGNRARRRLISLARWAFPDVWAGFAGSWPTAVAVLTRWPDLRALASARRSSVTAVVAAHTRGVAEVESRAAAIRAAAAAGAEFWDGHLDLERTPPPDPATLPRRAPTDQQPRPARRTRRHFRRLLQHPATTPSP